VDRKRKIAAIRKSEVPTVVMFKIAVFCNVTPFILVDGTNLSEEPAASVIRIVKEVLCLKVQAVGSLKYW
jgi:hypothetical protein